MKTTLICICSSLLLLAVQAQTTNRPPGLALRLQNVVKRGDTNRTAQSGSNAPSTQRLVSGFVGTLVSVNKEKQTVSIASGPPEQMKPGSISSPRIPNCGRERPRPV
jgi:hypothetical protein